MKKAIVYTKAGCPYCAKLMDELKQKGVPFEEVCVSYDRKALKEIKEKYGADRVPVLVEDDKVTIGYHGGPG